MYTQELICPNCDQVATVNVLTSNQKENPQSGSCGVCGNRIDFDVDSEGEIMEIRGSINRTSKTGNREPRW